MAILSSIESLTATELARLRRLAADTIRGLAMDAVQKANSGHPGMPMGMADAAVVLWTQFLKHNPADPVFRLH
jgi:transketolase